MFDKSEDLFPIKRRYVFLAHCGVSPLYGPACRIELEIAEAHRDTGAMVFRRYDEILDSLRRTAALLLRTSPDNLAFVKNTSEGMCMIADGFPFQKGDQIISYVHEYPANHYPWKLQETRGAELVLLPNRNITGPDPLKRPCAWTFEDLEERVTDRTRILALSHAQFTSGFAADMKRLGDFCASRNIDLVVDAAQSLGVLPLYPEEWNVSAIVSSGWKWLLGPVGTGLMYTSEPFRAKLGPVMVGAELMRQGSDYLNHSWDPHPTAKRFEYSTSPVSLAAALEAAVREAPLRYGPEAIRAEVFRLQDVLAGALDADRYRPLRFPDAHRSGILAVACEANVGDLVQALMEEGVVCSGRAGYLRLAPHFYLSDEEILRAASILNSVKV